MAPPPIPAEAPGLSFRIRKELASTRGEPFRLDVEAAVPPGITILFGPSGAGKSTLLQCLSGLLRPDSGTIAVGEKTLFDAGRGINRGVAQRSIGYLFQSLALFPHLTVEENVQYGLGKLAPAHRRDRALAILESFHIPHLARRRPAEISGGEGQRTALARALVADPCLLLLDEPLSALDAPIKARIIDDLRAWIAARPIPVLYVTHSREEVFALGERVIVLERGRLLTQGPPQQVLEAPQHETVAQLAGFENIFDAEVVALDPARGSMTCRLPPVPDGTGLHPVPHGTGAGASPVTLEVPLGRVRPGQAVRLGLRAGDILLAGERPRALSARNILPGKILRLVERDFIVVAEVDCGVPFVVHLTPGARESLGLAPGAAVWLVIKAHSCHMLLRE
jgi:molybdate transport system ATP-binding protein